MRLSYERDPAGNLQERFGPDVEDRILEELPGSLVPSLVGSRPVARLAVRVGGRVHVVPVNHLVEADGAVAFRSAQGRKLDLARRGIARAVLEVDHALDRLPGWYATVAGRLRPVLDDVDVARLERSSLVTFADHERRRHWLRLEPERSRAFRVSLPSTTVPVPGPRVDLDGPAPVPGRGQLEELDLAACEEILERAVVGRLALLSDGEPTVVPVVIGYLEGTLTLRSVMGDLLDEVAPDQPVVVEVDELDHDRWSGASVVVEGVLERVHARGSTEVRPAAAGELWRFPLPADEILRVRPVAVSGRRIVRDA